MDIIDFSKGFVFLDKELEKLSPDAESRRRHADKLIRAHLRDGREQWFLVHVEVQGYSDPDFGRRMFQYFYRIRDKYDRPLTALAIYTDRNRKFHFSEYREDYLGTGVRYYFKKFVLIDHALKELRASGNLFGLMLEVARRDFNLIKKPDDYRLSIKLRLARRLYMQGIGKRKIKGLFDFIEYYTRFDQIEFYDKFEKGIQSITKSKETMGVREAILEDLKKRSREEGLKEGLKEKEIAIKEMERQVIFRAWKKGMATGDIADLVNLPVEEVENMIQEFRDSQPED